MFLDKNHTQLIKTFSFICIIFLFGINNVYAQSIDELSDEQIQQFMKQAQESGMTEEQLMAAAALKGFSASDISKVKDRMTRLQTDKKALNTNTTDTERKYNDTTALKDRKQLLKKEDIKDSTAIRREKYFGLSLFNNNKNTFILLSLFRL